MVVALILWGTKRWLPPLGAINSDLKFIRMDVIVVIHNIVANWGIPRDRMNGYSLLPFIHKRGNVVHKLSELHNSQAFLRISVVDTLRFQWKGFLVGWISIQLWNEANRSAISLDIIECFVCQCVRAAHPPTIIGHSSRVVQLVKGVAPMALRDCKHNLRASWWPPDSYPPNLLWRWRCLDSMRWAELDYSGSWKKTDE